VVDGCGGHFGPTPGNLNTLTYHYHTRMSSPYTLGCFGPSWGVCSNLYNGITGACNTECAAANLRSSLCVASGYVDRFDVANVTFGGGYASDASALPSSGLAVMLLAVVACVTALLL
jgi:hypothetical protein